MPTFNDAYVIAPTCVELPHWTLNDPIVKGGAEFFAGSGRLSATVEATTGITPMIRIDFNATPSDHRHWEHLLAVVPAAHAVQLFRDEVTRRILRLPRVGQRHGGCDARRRRLDIHPPKRTFLACGDRNRI